MVFSLYGIILTIIDILLAIPGLLDFNKKLHCAYVKWRISRTRLEHVQEKMLWSIFFLQLFASCFLVFSFFLIFDGLSVGLIWTLSWTLSWTCFFVAISSSLRALKLNVKRWYYISLFPIIWILLQLQHWAEGARLANNHWEMRFGNACQNQIAISFICLVLDGSRTSALVRQKKKAKEHDSE